MNPYTGTIIEESLSDNRIVNHLHISKVRLSEEDEPAKRWHLYTVRVTRKQIESLADHMKQGWYMHFWDEHHHIIVVFKDHTFEFGKNDESARRDAIEYGVSVGIPAEQLDFPTE